MWLASFGEATDFTFYRALEKPHPSSYLTDSVTRTMQSMELLYRLYALKTSGYVACMTSMMLAALFSRSYRAGRVVITKLPDVGPACTVDWLPILLPPMRVTRCES